MTNATLHDLFVTAWGYSLNAGMTISKYGGPIQDCFRGDIYNLGLLSHRRNTILEIGSGYGQTANFLAEYFNEVYAVEPNINKCYRFPCHNRVKLYPDYFEKVSLLNGFSAAWLSESYSYFKDVTKNFTKIYALLEPGGEVLISDFFFKTETTAYFKNEAKLIRNTINEIVVQDFRNLTIAIGFETVYEKAWEKSPIQFYKKVKTEMYDCSDSIGLIRHGVRNMDARIKLLNESSYDKYSIVLRKVK